MSCDKFYSGDCPGQEPGQQKLDTAPPTGGDMLKSVYDTNNDGRVDSATHASSAGHAASSDEATKLTGVDLPGPGFRYYYGTGSDGTPGFHPLPIGSGGGGGGETALEELTDVLIISPTTGQALTYNAGTGKWGNADSSGGGGFSEDRILTFSGEVLVDVTTGNVLLGDKV